MSKEINQLKEKKLFLLETERINNLEILQEKLGMKMSTILNRLLNNNNNELFNRIIETLNNIETNQQSLLNEVKINQPSIQESRMFIERSKNK